MVATLAHSPFVAVVIGRIRVGIRVTLDPATTDRTSHVRIMGIFDYERVARPSVDCRIKESVENARQL